MSLDIIKVYFIIFQLTFYLRVGIGQTEVYGHKNSRDYYVDWKYIGPCERSKHGSNEIQMNTKLTKKNGRTQIMGNYTFLIPWDETIFFHVHLMKFGSNFAWIPNTFRWTLTGCSQYRLLLAGSRFSSHMNLPDTCPMPKGVYVLREYDTDMIVEDANSLLPKTFLYGNYKAICTITKKDKVVGCATAALDISPKWQKRNKIRNMTQNE